MRKGDKLFFTDEMGGDSKEEKKNWKIMIADDEEEVHVVTRMVLDNFRFEERGLTLLGAYSGSETIALLQQHPDTAVLLLDVVMEEDTTGLEVARYIREELQNRFVRIVLRTGQPGQAPERQVTMKYDINDYKEKTELTAQKLFTTIIGLLRAYRDLKTIEKSRKGLEQIAAISASLFEQQSLKSFMTGLLTHISTLLHFAEAGSSPQVSGMAMSRRGKDYYVLAGTGQFQEFEGKSVRQAVPPEIFQFIMQVTEQHQSLFSGNMYAGHFLTTSDSDHLLYIQSQYDLNDIDKELLKILATNVAVAFENMDLNQAIIETQREVIFTLGEVVETRSRRTPEHVKKVAEYSHLLALKAGLQREEADMLRLASPLYNVGKLGIPDAILDKQVPLTTAEQELLNQHPHIGYEILKGSKQTILQMAAELALQHHERWDGQGFPQGLREEQIHIFARITAIASVFNELTSHPVRAKTLDKDFITNFFRKERGTQLDPHLVDVFLDHLDEFLMIKDNQNVAQQDKNSSEPVKFDK